MRKTMNLSDAIKSIIRPHENDKLAPLTTIWGEQLDPLNLLSEYPRPQMQRESFINLNGYWDFTITDNENFPDDYEGKILVPFSPESALSGAGRQLLPGEFLWYRTALPDSACVLSDGNRLLLHFGAVDHDAQVYLNGRLLTSHQGGYLPFSVDITDALKGTDNELLVKVRDTTGANDEARGKQSLHRGGIFYTAQSGIWQTVWLEKVPFCHIKNLWFETDYDNRKVTLHIKGVTGSTPPSLHVTLSCQKDSSKAEIASATLNLHAPAADTGSGQEYQKPFQISLTLTMPEELFYPWSPESPFLYDAELTFGEDKISSYFAMRHFSIERKAVDGAPEKPVFCLNHEPCFLMGVLDQGYWPDGLYTAPSDEALIYDIRTMKELGFNMLRKHIKVESARWYYHCDRLGMIVCQDMVNGGSKYHMPVISYLPTLFPSLSLHIKDSHYAMLSRKNKEARTAWEEECSQTIHYLKFFPSIAIWVPFNEGWGQFDAARITDMIRSLDPSRLIDSASGWFDQSCGDFVSVHNYFRPLSVSVREWTNRAFFLSEYGGFACHIKDHSSVERVFGYKRYDTPDGFRKAYQELIEKSLLPLRKQGLSGAVYTQLSDVEEEVNGILTYDRKINKFLN